MTTQDLQRYLADNPDIPHAAALAKEGYLDAFAFPSFWEPLTEQLFVRLDDGLYQVESLESVRTTNWRLEAVDSARIQGLLQQYQAHFSHLERFFDLAV